MALRATRLSGIGASNSKAAWLCRSSAWGADVASNVKLNMKAFAEIRTAPKVMKMLDDIAEATASRAGEGFRAEPAKATGGRVRGRAAVITVTADAMRAQAKNRALERAIGGA